MRLRAVAVAGRFTCDPFDGSHAIDLHASAPRALEPPAGDHASAVPSLPIAPRDHGGTPAEPDFVLLAEFLKRA